MKYEFGFGKLVLIISSIFGIVGFFKNFYQLNDLHTHISGYDMVESWWQSSQVKLPVQTLQSQDILIELASWLILLMPVVMGLIALELLIRSLFSNFRIVHRVWVFVIYCFLASGASWWISHELNINFHFFEMVKSGYWWSVYMITGSFIAHWIED